MTINSGDLIVTLKSARNPILKEEITRVTANLKKKLEAAQAVGYERVYTVIGAYMATTYVSFYSIKEILEKPDGYRYGSSRPYPGPEMWTGVFNTRHVDHATEIQYSELFRRF